MVGGEIRELRRGKERPLLRQRCDTMLLEDKGNIQGTFRSPPKRLHCGAAATSPDDQAKIYGMFRIIGIYGLPAGCGTSQSATWNCKWWSDLRVSSQKLTLKTKREFGKPLQHGFQVEFSRKDRRKGVRMLSVQGRSDIVTNEKKKTQVQSKVLSLDGLNE